MTRNDTQRLRMPTELRGEWMHLNVTCLHPEGITKVVKAADQEEVLEVPPASQSVLGKKAKSYIADNVYMNTSCRGCNSGTIRRNSHRKSTHSEGEDFNMGGGVYMVPQNLSMLSL